MSLAEIDAGLRPLAWSLVHFLWQGALVAIALELALLCLRERSAGLRYVVRCAALAVMGAAPLVTFWILRRRGIAAGEAGPTAPAGPSGDGGVWLLLVVLVWSIGAGVCGARLLRGYLHIRRLQRGAAGDPLPAAWQARFDALARRLGVRAVARVIDSARLSVPTVVGWIQPVVLMPACVLTGLSREQVEALIAHELAHVRRHDFVVNLLQCALEALLFYHPAVWWVSKGIRDEREFCCDDVAVGLAPDRVAYARALATLEAWRGTKLQIAMSTTGGSLMHRIQRTVGIRPQARARGPLSALGVLLVAAALGTTAFGQVAHEGLQDSETLRAIRAHVAELQERVAELKALLDRLHGGHAREQDRELRVGPGHRPDVERLHDHLLRLHEREGDARLEPSPDVDVGKLHEHLNMRLHERAGDAPMRLELSPDVDVERLHDHLLRLHERHRNVPRRLEIHTRPKVEVKEPELEGAHERGQEHGPRKTSKKTLIG